ncbi:MAG: hypothetical protein IKW30_03675 [Lachnospiraceae bacterium]|nr:hypothetical protein [Lachnospiraceae bacterium]
MFTDTITLYNKVSDTEWKRTTVKGVQWSEKEEKQNNNGRISVAKYVSITFPESAYENLILKAENEEDCIVYSEVKDVITGEKGNRISDLLKKYPNSGRIKSVNNNSNRRLLKNIKVVIENG